MAIDINRILRLRSTIDAGASSNSTTALIELYRTAREQVLAMLEGELRTEFEELFPGWDARWGGGQVLGVTMGEARGRLRSIVGWLDGLIEGARYQGQLKANAEAYARERIKADRGIGFRSEVDPGTEGS